MCQILISRSGQESLHRKLSVMMSQANLVDLSKQVSKFPVVERYVPDRVFLDLSTCRMSLIAKCIILTSNSKIKAKSYKFQQHERQPKMI